MTALVGDPSAVAHLAAHGVRTLEDVLAQSECVRDLPDRSNHVLDVAGRKVFVKRRKRARRAAEADAIDTVRVLGVPVADVAFHAIARDVGAVTGTWDLAPARPLDDLLREGQLTRAQRRDALQRLARAAAALHQGGHRHRDLYLNHVFGAPAADACPIAIIDWERLGRCRRTLGRRVIKDLAAIASSLPDETVPLRERVRFLLVYLAARGVPRRGVYEGLVRRIRRKARRIRRHAPRTPVGDAARPGSAPA